MKKLALSIVAAGLGLSGSVHASTFVWDFQSPKGVTGSTHTYNDTTNTFSLTASGWNTQNAISKNAVLGNTWGKGVGFTYNTGTIKTNDLYDKFTNNNPGETGLGLYKTSDNEITDKSFVQLDTKSLKDNHLGNVTLGIGSIQTNEGFEIWGSNTAGTPGTLLSIDRNPKNGGVNQSIGLPDYNQYRYFSVSAAAPLAGSQSDVLLNTVSAQSVPEPMSMFALAGGVVTIIRKRRKSA